MYNNEDTLNSRLGRVMRTMSLRRDPQVLVTATIEDLQRFEMRRDVSNL
jgi:hypothetical protein